jgi:hypothetical protein
MVRQEPAALRDFELAYVRFGSLADFTPSLGQVRSAPRKRTSTDAVDMSARCQSRPNAPQQKKHRYSITSSASSCIALGTVIPSAVAVPRLITSSNLVAAPVSTPRGFSRARRRATCRSIRHGAACPLQCAHNLPGRSQDDIQRERDQLPSVSVKSDRDRLRPSDIRCARYGPRPSPVLLAPARTP